MACNANCLFCEQRKEHYQSAETHNVFSLEKWKEIIDQAIALGAEYVNISGGEPTLYPLLFKLITYCKSRGVGAHLKTNGYVVDEKFARQLADVKVDSCTVSLYSHKAFQHDALRRLNGSHEAAVKAIKNLIKVGIKTDIQTVLSSDLLKEFDQYLDWAASLKINTLFLSYLEGGKSTKSPTEKDISDFSKNMKPKCVANLSKFFNDETIIRNNEKIINSLFDFPDVSYEKIAEGIYNSQGLKGCGRNYSLAIVLANGEVHPCNAVEYFHDPVVGNLTKESLADAWNSDLWEDVKKNGLKYCSTCPMTRHTYIKFTNEKASPFYSSV